MHTVDPQLLITYVFNAVSVESCIAYIRHCGYIYIYNDNWTFVSQPCAIAFALASLRWYLYHQLWECLPYLVLIPSLACPQSCNQ